MHRFGKFVIGFMRCFGAMLTIIATIIFIQYLGILFDPEEAIKVNGVPSSDLLAKIGAVLFSSLFMGVGLLLLFLPASRLEGIFVPKFIRGKN